jgi:hypothetical protein
MSSITESISKLYPDLIGVNFDGTTYTGIDKDQKPVTLDMSAVNAEYAKIEYRSKREYPSIEEQLDQLYWDKKNGTNKWVETIDKVKSDNPKP